MSEPLQIKGQLTNNHLVEMARLLPNVDALEMSWKHARTIRTQPEFNFIIESKAVALKAGLQGWVKVEGRYLEVRTPRDAPESQISGRIQRMFILDVTSEAADAVQSALAHSELVEAADLAPVRRLPS